MQCILIIINGITYKIPSVIPFGHSFICVSFTRSELDNRFSAYFAFVMLEYLRCAYSRNFCRIFLFHFVSYFFPSKPPGFHYTLPSRLTIYTSIKRGKKMKIIQCYGKINNTYYIPSKRNHFQRLYTFHWLS